MKKMTCRQMGGTCDAEFEAGTSDEMMQKGASHVEEMAAQGDEGHQGVKTMMDEAQADPAKGQEWHDKFVADFEATPEVEAMEPSAEAPSSEEAPVAPMESSENTEAAPAQAEEAEENQPQAA